MKNLDHQLRLFLAIARSQSLSGAAKALDLTQSSLSKQLGNLESYLGQSLFERHGRGVALSEAGRNLHDVTRPAYELIDNCVAQLREHVELNIGSLRVATVHTLSYYFMPEVMAKFMSQRPKVNITLLGRSSPEVVELVESGKADVGFVYDTAVATDTVEITPLFTEDMCLVVHNSSPFAGLPDIDLEQKTVPLIVAPPHYALRRMLHKHRLDNEVAAEVETIDAMLKLASVTSGQCVLPDRIPSAVLQEFQLTRVPISHPKLQRRIVGIKRIGRVQSALVTLMLEIASTVSRLKSGQDSRGPDS
jgi:DNA-binding transcriptional LysR family regulator